MASFASLEVPLFKVFMSKVLDALIIAAGLLLGIVASPLALFYGLYRLLFYAMCKLQPRVSELRRRWLYCDNSRNRAAQLPEEVLLQIFHLLRTRARFGNVPELRLEHELSRWSPGQGYKHASLRDLASTRLACRLWYFPGTVALYTDVAFATSRECVQFADTLVAHTRYARFVRTIKLPPSAAYLAQLPLADMWNRIPDNGHTRWLDLRAAVNRILVQFTGLQSLSLWGAKANFDDIVSILPRSSALTRIACCAEACEGISTGFNVATAVLRFTQLEALTLAGQRLMTPHSLTGLPVLQTLRLHNCFIPRWFPKMLYRLPNIRVIDWQYNTILGRDPISTTLSRFYKHRRKDLVSCTFFTFDRPLHPPMEIAVADMSSFSSLRTLDITDASLRNLTAPPRCLDELIITVCEKRVLFEGLSRQEIFSIIHHLKLNIPRWKVLHSPLLRRVQLRDDRVKATQLRYWGIASYLFRPYLDTLRVDLTVNLTLGLVQEMHFRGRFARQRHLRRLLWRDVF